MNKKMFARGGFASSGKKIISILIVTISVGLNFSTPITMAELDPNYGTTTFFSEKNEIPSANPPIYDVGAKADSKISKDSKIDGDSNDDGDLADDGGLFSQVITSIGGFFSDSSVPSSVTEDSLFNWQQNSDTFGESSDGDGEFIMGARGESLDNIDDEEAAKYNDRIASGFNFKENSSKSTPKKSKLLFTNIVIPVNMTTQYFLIGFVFVVAISLVVGYYFWKKEATKSVIDPNEEY